MAETKMGVMARRNTAKEQAIQQLGLDLLAKIDNSVFISEQTVTDLDGTEVLQYVKITVAACNMEGSQGTKRPVAPFDFEAEVADYEERLQLALEEEAEKRARKAKKDKKVAVVEADTPDVADVVALPDVGGIG